MESVGASNCPSITYSSRNFINVMKVASVETTAAEGWGTLALISDNSGVLRKLGLRTSQKSMPASFFKHFFKGFFFCQEASTGCNKMMCGHELLLPNKGSRLGF